MHQKEIGRRRLFARRISARICLQLAIGFTLLNSGATKASIIDANFKLGRQTQSGNKVITANEVSTLYKGFLAKSMYSRCRWFPSDSEYMRIASIKCGAAKGTLLAFSRFMTEHDAYRIAEGMVNDNDHVRFLDFGHGCDFF